MDILKAVQKQRLHDWAEMVKACSSSGKTVNVWCEASGVNRKPTITDRSACSTYCLSCVVLYKTLRLKTVYRSSNYRREYCQQAIPKFALAEQARWSCGSRFGNSTHGAASIIRNMLKDFTSAAHIYIACGYTDLRKGIDGLSLLVQQSFALDPFSNSPFLFCGKRNDRIKALYWEGDGFVLLYKRLERGRFQWSRTAEQVRELSSQQYRWLMEGLAVEQPKALKPCGKLALG